jgi:hypothetical protein
MKHSRSFLFALFLLLIPAAAQSQQSPTATQSAPQPAPCSAPEFRQFDFWVGSWVVAGPDGKEQGRSEITREAAGCGINEHWTGAGGAPGVSLNYFDRADGKWHQHWVGGGGGVLHLAGGFDGKAMVMSGERQTRQGRVTDRITWTPLQDGRVSQQWDTSTDGGKSWKTIFLGYYSRRADTKPVGK